MSTTVLWTEDDGTVGEDTVTDNYLVVVDGSAYVSGAVVHRAKDGTATHVITVKAVSPVHLTGETR